jgi:hypothetical protein
MTDEEYVYRCLINYQTSAMSTEILKAYDFDDKRIIKVLAGYANKTAYHGHMTGTPQQGVATAAQDNQLKALNYLRDNKPAQGTTSKKKVTDAEKRGANINYANRGIQFIDQADNLGTARMLLDAWDKNWEKNTLVNGHYTSKKLEKKAALEAKKFKK